LLELLHIFIPVIIIKVLRPRFNQVHVAIFINLFNISLCFFVLDNVLEFGIEVFIVETAVGTFNKLLDVFVFIVIKFICKVR
jgi:hypothetical protein